MFDQLQGTRTSYLVPWVSLYNAIDEVVENKKQGIKIIYKSRFHVREFVSLFVLIAVGEFVKRKETNKKE